MAFLSSDRYDYDTSVTPMWTTNRCATVAMDG